MCVLYLLSLSGSKLVWVAQIVWTQSEGMFLLDVAGVTFRCLKAIHLKSRQKNPADVFYFDGAKNHVIDDSQTSVNSLTKEKMMTCTEILWLVGGFTNIF